MFKFLLVLALIALVWWHLKKRAAGAAEPPPRERPPERMVQCARCGVFLPESDSFAADGRHYCCEAHRQAER